MRSAKVKNSSFVSNSKVKRKKKLILIVLRSSNFPFFFSSDLLASVGAAIGSLSSGNEINFKNTHADFTINNVYETSKDYDKIEDIPRITKIVLIPKFVSKQKEEKKHTPLLVGCFMDLH